MSAADLDQATPTEAERLDRPFRHVVEAQEVERALRPLLLVGVGPPEVQEVLHQPTVPAPGALGHEHVVADAHAGEELDALEGPPEAQTGPPVDGQAGDVALVEDDPACLGSEDAEEAVEERRLARAVRADEADRLTRRHLEGDVVERGDAREALGHPAGVEQTGAVASAVIARPARDAAARRRRHRR